MTDYSQFEASTKSGIHADPNRIWKHDEIIGKVLKQRKSSKIYCVICTLLAATCFFIHWIITVILGLAALFFLWRGTGKISDDYLKEVYEEGLLVPGLIIKTKPLTILAIANLTAQSGAETINGCFFLVVKDLDGAKKELHEKIPCSCFFCYEGGSYHSSFEPHPLYWGTSDKQEIQAALMQVEEDNKENSQDEWEVLMQIADQFPELKDQEIVLLDKNYVPFGIKSNGQSDYRPLNLETAQQSKDLEIHGQNHREELNTNNGLQEDIPYLTQDIPGREIYNKMIETACRLHVYEYISGHCKLGHLISFEHPGLFTYIGDSLSFLQEVQAGHYTLAEGEYPLIYEKCLITNNGCYQNKEFLPWDKIDFSIKFNFENGMKLLLNGKKIAEFATHFDNYPNAENMTEQEQKMAAQKEAARILDFMRELKHLSAAAQV